MNLNYALPQREDLLVRGLLCGEEILYCLPYDLNERGSYVDGYFIITKTRIILLCNGEIASEYKIKAGEDYLAEDLVSSGRIEGVFGGEVCVLAYYTMEHVPRYAYAQRILNELAVGEMPKIESIDDEKKCPKCGRAYLKRTKICPHCLSKISAFGKIAMVVKPSWYLYVIILVLFWCNSGVMLYQPLVNRYIVDRAILPMSSGTMPLSLPILVFYIALIAACNLAVSLIGVGRQYVTTEASSRLARDLKNMVYSKVQELSISYLDEQKTGNLMNRISRDTQRVQNFIQNIASQAVNEIFLLLGVLIALFLYNWKMAALAVLPIPLVVVFCGGVHDRMHKMYRNQWVKMDKLNSFLNDILNGIRVVKAFGQEERAIGQFQDDAESVRRLTTKTEHFYATLIPAIRFLMTLGSLMITFYGASLVLKERLSVGELLQFSTYASYLYGRLEWFSMLPRWMSEAANAIERIFEVLDHEPEITDEKNAVDADIKGNISMVNVTFGYKTYQPVVKNLSVDINHGEMIGLVGHSGAGKSTVINLLMRLYDADEGDIFIDGINIRNLSQASFKSQIGVVLQETFLFSGTILENIRYAKPEATIDEVIRAAKIANAHDFIVSFPNGYDTRVGERGQRLSGGERQRIAIARAVLTDPKILILDEATASVDTETEQLIQEALKRLIKGRTTIAIAHRLSTLKNADRIMVMDHGKLAEFGTHEALMQNEGIYYTLVMAQKKMSAIKAL
ncbi:MAG: ABC transporter transmembrane domain-containing protein [Clostridia bacterium]|nr:ABC transporter transmembrane domain-containing protein [Clostridia bacterium]